jgi:leader peptidase (prepilin peptidase)/N-methyltransferase
MHNIVPYIVAFLFGSVIGSFLNVCIYRIPRNPSIISPSSRCPSCNNPISPSDNIPIVSYIFLSGKCRICKAKISFRYPLIEFLNAALYILILWRFGFGWHILAYFIFCSALVVIAFIDLDFQIIPDRITLLGIPIGLIAGSFLLPDPFMRSSPLGLKASFIGICTGFVLFYVVAVIGAAIFKKEALGGGDIKLMAMLGGIVGWKGVLLTTFLGSLSGSLIGVLLMIIHKDRKNIIPFGPFLVLGSIISLFYGQEIVYWYLGR